MLVKLPLTGVLPVRSSVEFAHVTLIELLVVIDIIAILAAILFPVFAQAREAARKTQCTSNARQVATAVAMYLQDYDEKLGFACNYWGVGVYPSGGTSNNTTNGIVPPSIYLGPYIKNFGVFSCPSAPIKTPTSGNTTYGSLISNYGWNWQITYVQSGYPAFAGRTGPLYEGTTLAMLERPAETVIMGDSNPSRLQGSYIYPHTNVNTATLGYQGKPLRHQEGDNYVFLDGHAKWVKGEKVRDYVWTFDNRLGTIFP